MSSFQFVTPMYRDGDPAGQGQLGANILADGRLEVTVMSAPNCFASTVTLPEADRERLLRYLSGAMTGPSAREVGASG